MNRTGITGLSRTIARLDDAIVYFWNVDNKHLPGMCASDSPQATIPPTPYQPDTVLYNEGNNSIALLELKCPLASVEHLNSARDRNMGRERVPGVSVRIRLSQTSLFL